MLPALLRRAAGEGTALLGEPDADPAILAVLVLELADQDPVNLGDAASLRAAARLQIHACDLNQARAARSGLRSHRMIFETSGSIKHPASRHRSISRLPLVAQELILMLLLECA